MPQEYQVIEHNYYRGLNLFLSRLYYRAPHYHRECELMMALEGEADIIFSNGKVSRLTAGNVAVLGPMELHEMRSGEDGVLLITIQTSFAVLEYFLSHRISPFYAVDTDVSQFMTEQEQQTLRNICYELALAYPGMPEDMEQFSKQGGFPKISFVNLADLQGEGGIPNKQKLKKKKKITNRWKLFIISWKNV